MALATNTSPGEIQLAGDLAGNNDASAPELTATAVTPGAYNITNITVDAKGRVTAASNASSGDIEALIGDATTISKGVIQVGDNVDVAAGVISVPAATTGTLGVVQVGVGLFVSNGVLTIDTDDIIANLPLTTTSTKGVTQVGTNIDVAAGVISIADGSDIVKGVLQVGTNIDVAAGVISVADGSAATKGVLQVGDGLNATAGVISADTATTVGKGIASVGSGLLVSNGVLSVDDATYAKINTTNNFTAAQRVAQYVLTYSASITPDFNLTNVFELTLTGSPTINNPTNVVSGGQYVFLITHNANTITWGANFDFDGSTTMTGTTSIIICIADGTTLRSTVVNGW